MGREGDIWVCDVCNAAIPDGRKRYPLDGGRTCCPDCWTEIRGTASPEARASPPTPEQRPSRWSGHAIAGFILSLAAFPVPTDPEEGLYTPPFLIGIGLAAAWSLCWHGLDQIKAGKRERGRGLATAGLVISGLGLFLLLCVAASGC